MSKNNTDKNKIILYLCVLVAVFAMFIGSSYMFYIRVLKKDDNTKVTIKNLDMLIMFDKQNQINAYNLKPGWEEYREFSIKNYSNDAIGKYNISLEIITPLSNMVDENFTYSLEGESESKDTSNSIITVNESIVPVLTKQIGNASITPNNTHTYKLKIKLNDKAESSKYKNSMFSAKVKIIYNND